MSRTVKDADVRRLELLETSLSLFGERGYERVSVQDITEAVGIAKGTFYHYFDSKEELLAEIAQWQADQLVASTFSGPAGDSAEPLDELRALMSSLVRWQMDTRRELLVAYLRTMYREENLALRVRFTADYLRLVRPRIAELLAIGAARGDFSVTNPDATSDVIVSMWRGMNDHIAEVLLAEDRLVGLSDAMTHLQAMEEALERVLGLAPGQLALFDYVELEGALRSAIA